MDYKDMYDLEHKTCNYLFKENERLNAIIDDYEEKENFKYQKINHDEDVKRIDELLNEIHELLYNVVGMSYNTEKALELNKKIKELKENE